MKFSAAIIVLFSSAPVFAADWAPRIDAGAIAAVQVPAPAPARALPRDGANYSGAEEMLVKEFGITGIDMDIPEYDVVQQSQDYPAALSFDQAMRRALESFLGDPSIEGSALSDVLREMGVRGRPSDLKLKKAREALLARLNAPSSKIVLVRPYRNYQPARGEQVEKNWVFYINMNGRSYWAVIDRSGAAADYNYGAN